VARGRRYLLGCRQFRVLKDVEEAKGTGFQSESMKARHALNHRSSTSIFVFDREQHTVI